MDFVVVVTIHNKELDRKKMRELFWHKEMRFATLKEILDFTATETGSVYPFGHPVKMPIFVDDDIFNHKYFLFNPARKDKTIQIHTTEFKNIILHFGAIISNM